VPHSEYQCEGIDFHLIYTCCCLAVIHLGKYCRISVQIILSITFSALRFLADSSVEELKTKIFKKIINSLKLNNPSGANSCKSIQYIPNIFINS
jgi:hypothetical protein